MSDQHNGSFFCYSMTYVKPRHSQSGVKEQLKIVDSNEQHSERQAAGSIFFLAVVHKVTLLDNDDESSNS